MNGDTDSQRPMPSPLRTDNEETKTDVDTQDAEPTSSDDTSSSQGYRIVGPKQAEVERVGWLQGINMALGGVVMCLVGAFYTWYLYTLHENRLWFSNILEVEREISFRTESGLYYSYYKQMIQSPSFAQGLWELTADNNTENWRTINILNRFNIYQEVFLAAVYRGVPFISVHLAPIFFYVYFIFALHGGYIMALYGLGWLLGGSWISGLLTAVFYVCNRAHTTRVDFTVPLRESFALPLYSFQLLMVTIYLKNSASIKYEKFKLLAVFLSTFGFTITWQFAQFILLLQTAALYMPAILGVMAIRKVQQLLLCSMAAILFVAFLQFSNKMLLGSLALSFILAAYTLLAIMSDRSSTIGLFHNLWRVCVRSISVLGLTYLLNHCTKVLIGIEDDQHIFKFLQIKFGLTDQWDFDSHLYVCHSAFEFMPWSVVSDLSKGFLFPIYVVTMAGLGVGTLITAYNRWTEVPSEEVPSCDYIRESLTVQSSLIAAHPELSFHLVHSALCGLMAAMVMRMKYVWVPQACVLAAFGVGLPKLWRTLLATTSHTTIQVVRNSALVVTLALLLSKSLPSMRQEQGILQEFYDPDTVELMRWISYHTPQEATFSGSMQLLAGVKLSTGRKLTNHPHYEDKELRQRTQKLYQFYSRRSVEEVYDIHSLMGSDYIILEDSICMARGPQGCRLIDAIDLANGHMPDYSGEGGSVGERPVQTLRFCEAIKAQSPEQVQYFMKVFHNHTFRVYKVMANGTSLR